MVTHVLLRRQDVNTRLAAAPSILEEQLEMG
jgi:hypothetical protein